MLNAHAAGCAKQSLWYAEITIGCNMLNGKATNWNNIRRKLKKNSTVGGILTGGILSSGILSGAFCSVAFCPVAFYPGHFAGGILSGAFWPVTFCPVAFCPGLVFLDPYQTFHWQSIGKWMSNLSAQSIDNRPSCLAKLSLIMVGVRLLETRGMYYGLYSDIFPSIFTHHPRPSASWCNMWKLRGNRSQYLPL